MKKHINFVAISDTFTLCPQTITVIHTNNLKMYLNDMGVPFQNFKPHLSNDDFTVFVFDTDSYEFNLFLESIPDLVDLQFHVINWPDYLPKKLLKLKQEQLQTLLN